MSSVSQSRTKRLTDWEFIGREIPAASESIAVRGLTAWLEIRATVVEMKSYST